jgi:hypothetical protein
MREREPNEGVLDHILYLIVLPEEGSGAFTPFQGFSLNTSAAVPAIAYISKHLPPTITDVFRTREEAIGWRTAGLAGYAVVLLDLQFLAGFEGGLPNTCIVSCEGTREAVHAHIREHGRWEWLHLTTEEETADVPQLWTFSRADIFLWGRRNVERILAERAAAGRATTNPQLRSFIEWPPSSVEVSWQPHNITLPTEAALESLGLTVSHGEHNLTGQGDEKFARAIREYAELLEGVRDRATLEPYRIPGTPRLIVTVPSVYRHLSPRGVRREATGPVRRAARNVLRQQQYIAMRAPAKESLEVIKDPLASGVLAIRADELRAYSAALSVTAASLCAPGLAVPASSRPGARATD